MDFNEFIHLSKKLFTDLPLDKLQHLYSFELYLRNKSEKDFESIIKNLFNFKKQNECKSKSHLKGSYEVKFSKQIELMKEISKSRLEKYKNKRKNNCDYECQGILYQNSYRKKRDANKIKSIQIHL